jgi:hypothetical protein
MRLFAAIEAMSSSVTVDAFATFEPQRERDRIRDIARIGGRAYRSQGISGR